MQSSLVSRVEDSLGLEVIVEDSGEQNSALAGPLAHPENEVVEDTLDSKLCRNIIPRAVEGNEYRGGDLSLDKEDDDTCFSQFQQLPIKRNSHLEETERFCMSHYWAQWLLDPKKI